MAKALRRADALVLATDPDREGEAIAWQVPSWLRKQDAVGDRAVHQVAVHEVRRLGCARRRRGPPEHRHGLGRGPGRRAARSTTWWATGLSPVLWRQLPGCRSAGRVQSVALLLICEGEAEIEAFAPRAYWTVTADRKRPSRARRPRSWARRGACRPRRARRSSRRRRRSRPCRPPAPAWDSRRRCASIRSDIRW